MHTQFPSNGLPALDHHNWMVFGFTSVLKLLGTSEHCDAQATVLQPTLYAVETSQAALPHRPLLHYLHHHLTSSACRFTALKQLAAGLRYTSLSGQSLDNVYVEDEPEIPDLPQSSCPGLHIVYRGRSVLRFLPDPAQRPRPDGGVFIQGGHPLAWFEIGPPAAVAQFAATVTPQRPLTNAAAITVARPTPIRHLQIPPPIWAWAPTFASALADLDAFSAAESTLQPAL